MEPTYFFMGNIRDRFTELIPKTGQHYIPLLSPFEEFHTSVLKIKKSTTELHSAVFSYISIHQDHIHQVGREGVGEGNNIAFKKLHKEIKIFLFLCMFYR